MKQALHIFRKDARCLWFPLSMALALQILFTVLEMLPHYGADPRFDSQIPGSLMLLAWWCLIAALVHEEPLPGDRQFWITRPYSSKSLLAAKVLFILTFVNLPVLIADCCILTSQGFSVAGHWSGVLWRQIPFTLFVLLLPLALASFTRNLGQVILTILLVIGGGVLNSLWTLGSLPGGVTAMGWMESALSSIGILVVLSAVVLIQYQSRRTWLARTLAGAFVLIPSPSIPMHWQLGLQAWVKPPVVDTASIKITFDSTRERRARLKLVRGVNHVALDIPVTVSGTPAGVHLVSGWAKLTVGGYDFAEGATLEEDKSGYWEDINIPSKVYYSLRNEPVSFRITPVVTAVRLTEFRMPLEGAPVRVPEIGICESWRPAPTILNVACLSALRPPLQARVHADYPGWDAPDRSGRLYEQYSGQLSDSPFPAQFSLSPVQRNYAFGLAGKELATALEYPGTQLVFEIRHPVAHFQTEIEVRVASLDDYAVMAPER